MAGTIWHPDAIIFCGIQASGKSTFYKEHFFRTHVRINLDMLKTRHRERRLLETCIAIQQPFVVDNTNPTIAERAQYIAPARAAGFRVIGYYFRSDVRDSITRDQQRSSREQVPARGIAGTAKRLQVPSYAEGFDQLYYVRISPAGGFVIEAWKARS